MRRLTGRTPPRAHEAVPARLRAAPSALTAVGLLGLALVLALRVAGAERRLGCGPDETLADALRSELTLTCPARDVTIELAGRADATLETHSSHDLYLEVYRGETRLGENDDGGHGRNARLVLTLDPGRYRVRVRPYRASLGGYVLTRRDGPPSAEVPGCTDTCRTSRDNECDDGGPGSLYDVCALGTDCADCGPR